ncbi:MAG: hypothetical protein JWM56_848 [Candidatus Peribacteria bacterium]|nr:hypothetical protein [Candidatus Peribacteria bacterium]
MADALTKDCLSFAVRPSMWHIIGPVVRAAVDEYQNHRPGMLEDIIILTGAATRKDFCDLKWPRVVSCVVYAHGAAVTDGINLLLEDFLKAEWPHDIQFFEHATCSRPTRKR